VAKNRCNCSRVGYNRPIQWNLHNRFPGCAHLGKKGAWTAFPHRMECPPRSSRWQDTTVDRREVAGNLRLGSCLFERTRPNRLLLRCSFPGTRPDF
jgi:hypothetical protein